MYLNSPASLDHKAYAKAWPVASLMAVAVFDGSFLPPPIPTKGLQAMHALEKFQTILCSLVATLFAAERR
jgi:hypothetical protein